MKDKASVVIIGGGISGCSLAYYLSKKGLKDVILLEKNFLGAGSTGRCGGGVRQQFNTKDGITLAMESTKMYKALGEELNVDIEYKRNGYLFLAETQEQETKLKKNIELQQKIGLEVKYIKPKKVREIVPNLNTKDLLGASYCPTDGYLNPFKVLYGYANNAKKRGVDIRRSTKAIDIKVKDRSISSVITNNGEIETKFVVNAAGANARKVADMVDIDLPVLPYKREMLVTESINNIIDPFIISSKGAIRQTENGELIMNTFKTKRSPGINLRASLDFLKRTASSMSKLIPILKNLNIVRQWAGHYSMTPDETPILGKTDKVQGFIQSNGYNGYGLMIAPRVGELLAELIIDGKTSSILEKYNLRRFINGFEGSIGPDIFGIEYIYSKKKEENCC